MDPTGNGSVTASYDFENPINLAEDEGEDDCEVPVELARLLLQEERAIQPHEDPVETVNLGTETDKKEVKIGENLELSVKQRLIHMLHDYIEIFSWSYEDMPGSRHRHRGSPSPHKRRLSTDQAKSSPNEA